MVVYNVLVSHVWPRRLATLDYDVVGGYRYC